MVRPACVSRIRGGYGFALLWFGLVWLGLFDGGVFESSIILLLCIAVATAAVVVVVVEKCHHRKDEKTNNKDSRCRPENSRKQKMPHTNSPAHNAHTLNTRKYSGRVIFERPTLALPWKKRLKFYSFRLRLSTMIFMRCSGLRCWPFLCDAHSRLASIRRRRHSRHIT